MTINLRRIEFFDREKEAEEIINILKAEPRLINFIYGPINSGKTTLINNLVENLPPDYVVFYINLRGKFISDYEDFIRAMFRVEKNKDLKEILKDLAVKTEKTIRHTGGLPINESVLESLFKKKTEEDVFEFLEDYFKDISKTKIPVFIIDELQVIGDLKIDEYLIYRLFNFFIRLTKELHLCHVFAVSSDSLFIEKVYNEAMLQGRARYLLVDDFDLTDAKRFLKKYKFTEYERKIALDYLGGKPAHLVELIDAKLGNKSLEKVAKRILEIRKGQIEEVLYSLKDENKELFDKVIAVLKNFDSDDKIKYVHATKDIRFLARQNILFADSVKRIIRPQSKNDLIAIREILREMK